MNPRLLPIAALVLGLSAAGCSSADPTTSDSESNIESAATGVENVQQYAECLTHGVEHGGGAINLANIAPGPSGGSNGPGGGAQGIEAQVVFDAANCIVSRLTKFRGQDRRYVLQSYKIGATSERTFFFKRATENLINEPPSECLKIKLSVTIGATDAFVTINRVKQLPPAGPSALCSDNGES